MITFVATVLLGWLSSASLTAFIPSLFGMFVYSDFNFLATHALGHMMYGLPQSHCGDNREGTLFS